VNILCGLLLALLMAPIFLIGVLAAMFDLGHYLRIRKM
jgi:hypothetical protein